MDCNLMKGHGVMGGGKICENCPYPDCIGVFDRKRKKPKWIMNMQRNDLIVKMSSKGKTTSAIAERFNLDPRHIRRILARYGKISQLCEKEIRNER